LGAFFFNILYASWKPATWRGKPMTKSDLAEKLSGQIEGLKKKECEIVVDTIFGAMAETLRAGKKIEIRGFGSFTVRTRKAKEGRNPKTGEAVSIPEKRVPFFKAGKELKEALGPLGGGGM